MLPKIAEAYFDCVDHYFLGLYIKARKVCHFVYVVDLQFFVSLYLRCVNHNDLILNSEVYQNEQMMPLTISTPKDTATP